MTVEAPVADLAGAAFELVIVEEPPIVSDRHLPPVNKPAWQKMTVGRAVKAPVAGTSISDSPALSAGTYRSSILTGETQVYAVDLDWGQRLQVQMLAALVLGAGAMALRACTESSQFVSGVSWVGCSV